MVSVDAHLRQIGAQGLVELQYRLAETVVRDADALEAALANASLAAKRFASKRAGLALRWHSGNSRSLNTRSARRAP